MCSRTAVLAAALVVAPLAAKGADLVVWWEEGWYPEEDRAVAELVAAFEQKTGKQVELLQPTQDEMSDKIGGRWRPGDRRTSPMEYCYRITMTRWAYEDRLVDLRDALGHFSDLFDPDLLERATLLNKRAGGHGLYALPMGRDTNHVHVWHGVVAFPYAAGASRIDAPGQKIAEFKPGGHWTRSLLASPDRRKLYAGVGSLSNIGESGMAAEEGRAAIYELDLASGTSRIFASGLRNRVGLAREPRTGTLWTAVNERDGLGDETPPDYLTSVRDGGFYGWPYCYWGQTVDDRVPQDPAAVAKAITPDYALGGHTASLGLCWLPAETLPGFPEGMAIGQHGSWNRSTLSGYKVIFVPDERMSYGRPVGVAIGPDGSLLVADDVGDAIWRVTGERQG